MVKGISYGSGLDQSIVPVNSARVTVMTTGTPSMDPWKARRRLASGLLVAACGDRWMVVSTLVCWNTTIAQGKLNSILIRNLSKLVHRGSTDMAVCCRIRGGELDPDLDNMEDRICDDCECMELQAED